MVDVVEVDDVGPELLEDRLDAAPRRGRVEHPAHRHGPAVERARGRVQLHPAREVALELAGAVVGMGHREEGDAMAVATLEAGDVLHVRLGAAAAVEELVHVQDPHRRPASRRAGLNRMTAYAAAAKAT